jgi:hypothetical protein
LGTVDGHKSGELISSRLGRLPIYMKGASGNVVTEDVVYLLYGFGIKSNVDLSTLVVAWTFYPWVFGPLIRVKAALALSKLIDHKSKI